MSQGYCIIVLTQLQARGKLDGEHAAKLKKKYTELHETLKRSHANETKLVTDVKELSQVTILPYHSILVHVFYLYTETGTTKSNIGQG